MAIEIAFETSVDVGEGAQSLKSLKKEFKEAQSQLDGLTVGSDKYIASLKRLGEIKDDIGDLNTTIKAFNPEGKMQAFTTVVGGVASGFQAATGAAALFGGESKDLEKALLKVQAVMAFTEGIKGVIALGDGFQVLKAVILSNPLFIIAGLVVALGTALYAVKDKIAFVGDAFETLGKVIDMVVDGFKAFTDWCGISDFAQEKLANSIIENNKKIKASVTSRYDIEISQAKRAGEDTEKLEMRKLYAITKTNEAIIKQLELRKQKNGELSEDDAKKLKELQDQNQNYYRQILDLDDAYNDKLKERNAKRIEEDKKNNEERLDNQRAYLDEIRKKTEENNKKIAEEKKLAKEKETEILIEQIKREWDLQNEKEVNRANAVHEFMTIESEKGLQEKLALIDYEKKQEIEKSTKTVAELEIIEIKSAKKIRDAKMAAASQYLEFAAQGINALQSLSNTVMNNQLARAGEDEVKKEEIRRKAFEREKAFALVGAAISGAQATLQTMATLGPPVYPNITGIIGMAVTAATNIAQIAAIASQQYSGGGGSASSTSVASVSTPSTSSSSPSINAPTSGNTQLNPDGTLRSANVTQQQPTVRAIVVETDMTTTQRRVSTIEERSKF